MRVYIETYGCASSQNDAEIMAGLLAAAGHAIVNKIEESDAVIINTCIVKSPTENKIKFRIRQLQEKYPKKKLVIAGCMPEAEYDIVKKIAPKANIISTNKIRDIAMAVENEKFESVGKEKTDKTCLPKFRKNPAVEIIEICSGCNHACSYCITKLAKGDILSYDPEKIIRQMKESPAKEFWLTGQDVSAYGKDNKYSLPDLLNNIADSVKGRYYIRLGMMNPGNVLDILEDLINSYKNENIFKFLHLPVQSGSDDILEKMSRNYTAKDSENIIKKFRARLPAITIWTDIIVGFPGENEDDFVKSVDLLQKIKPDFVNISAFGPRPGTQAAGMRQLDRQIIKQRTKVMTEIVEKLCYEANQRWLGWSGSVLVDEYNGRNWIGRNFAYKPVVLEGKYELGDVIDLKIAATAATHLRAG
jgi:MiaB-like tRNA modifying enzyme